MKLKVFQNKRTKQLSIVLPRKQMSILKKKNPKYLDIEVKEC